MYQIWLDGKIISSGKPFDDALAIFNYYVQESINGSELDKPVMLTRDGVVLYSVTGRWVRPPSSLEVMADRITDTILGAL